MRYYSLEKYINLFDGYRKVFKIDSHNLMLLQLDGSRYLIESNCPHREYPLVVRLVPQSSFHIQGYHLLWPDFQDRFVNSNAKSY
ncbi:MAG: hypothetical protein KKF24_11355, partial [Gammaproteobacteria bacterium]|nr:hypothetical protein [Gammaproteobacteria bacterium]MBU1833280.1 hypothetical protein [Gammaproteobacteria bacterium]